MQVVVITARTAKVILFSVVSVCMFVCFVVCLYNNCRTVRGVITKFSRRHPRVEMANKFESGCIGVHMWLFTVSDVLVIFYASALLGGANAYMFYRCFFLFFFRPPQWWCINMRQLFSGTAERIFMKLLPNDRGDGVSNTVPKWGLGPPNNFLGSKNWNIAKNRDRCVQLWITSRLFTPQWYAGARLFVRRMR